MKYESRFINFILGVVVKVEVIDHASVGELDLTLDYHGSACNGTGNDTLGATGTFMSNFSNSEYVVRINGGRGEGEGGNIVYLFILCRPTLMCMLSMIYA